jgi:hypothetical protein
MDGRSFDAIVRHAAQAHNRRGLIALLAGAVLATIATRPAMAKGGGVIGGGGKGGGGGKKKCKKDAKVCRKLVVKYCALYYSDDPFDFAVCYDNYNQLCCIPLGKCQRPASVCF